MYQFSRKLEGIQYSSVPLNDPKVKHLIENTILVKFQSMFYFGSHRSRFGRIFFLKKLVYVGIGQSGFGKRHHYLAQC